MKPKSPRPATKADETPEFQEFWKAWSTIKSEYDGRGAARDAFFRFVWWKDADPQDILDGALYYVNNFKAGQLRLLASNWMERGCYEDDAEKWRAHQRRLEESRQRSSQTSENVVQMARPAISGNTAFLRNYTPKPRDSGQ